MKILHVQILDPSGHVRKLKWKEFPFEGGTELQDRNQLRDPKIKARSFRIDQKEDGFILRFLAEGLNALIGDLKLSAFEIPYGVPIKIADTEITFSDRELREPALEFPAGEQAWFTESDSGLNLLHSLRKSSATKLSIYLSGETGTGKEVLAKLAHLWSARASGSFIPINCGALSMSLVESELFGHVKGAYTGAVKDRPGALLQAHGGTLFLDEVGDLPPELQMKLLRFLESGEIRPVGSDRVLHADVRLICATHKPLLKLVQEGSFRQDLYFRLASIPIEIPNLRSRPEDIKLLSLEFASEQKKCLTPEAVRKLQSHLWPGNVRELRHAIERASGLSGPDEPVVHAHDFDFLQAPSGAELNLSEENSEKQFLPGITKMKDMEKIMILRALKLANGNRSDAAKVLGVARSTLFEMMKRHAIVGPKSNDYWMKHLTVKA